LSFGGDVGGVRCVPIRRLGSVNFQGWVDDDVVSRLQY